MFSSDVYRIGVRLESIVVDEFSIELRRLQVMTTTTTTTGWCVAEGGINMNVKGKRKRRDVVVVDEWRRKRDERGSLILSILYHMKRLRMLQRWLLLLLLERTSERRTRGARGKEKAVRSIILAGPSLRGCQCLWWISSLVNNERGELHRARWRQRKEWATSRKGE